MPGGIGHEAAIVRLQSRPLPGPHETDDHDIGERNCEVEIGLFEMPAIEIRMHRAERDAVAYQRYADGIGIVQ